MVRLRAFVFLFAIATPLGAPCAAQTQATHDVRVTVPVLLRLRIDDAARSAVEVPLAINVAAGIARIEPDHSRIHILANTRWQLTAAFAPAEGSERLTLGYAVDDRPVTVHGTTFAPVILRGEATGGWRERVVRYALGDLPADGRYGGVVTFTLSRP